MWFCQSQQGRKQGSKNLSKIHLCGWLRKAIYSQSSWNMNIPPQTGQQNGENRSRDTAETSPGVRLQVQAVE